jgi:L-cysteine:1D-myo-inositol 2-amino-2-deoxy-alpha-D-glucopyranoside ligase
MGHAATYVAWDLLIRAWRDAGHQVSYVQNVTDVDDPLLERANRDGEDWRALAARDIELFRTDMTALRVLPPAHFVGAVEALPLIANLNGLLAERGSLYDLDGDVYFSRSADPAFGSVSGLDGERMYSLCAENGGDPGRPGKKDPVDPLVWLAQRPGEPSWPSAFGPGRPGWHVECAAIATHYLGTTFDVQAGGRDLIFPHHEMSASHARVALGGDGEPPFARHYAHSGMVRLDGEKMSKSRGNLVFVSGLLAAGHDAMAIRLAILAHHYRQDWDWTDGCLERAEERLARWRAAVAANADAPGDPSGLAGTGPGYSGSADSGPAAATMLAAIRERLADDLDAPGALAVMDSWAAAVTADDAAVSGDSRGSGKLIRDAADALLGVAL